MATRRRYIDGDVQLAIERLAIDDRLSPTQIRRKLERNSELAARLPDVRTVQRIVHDVSPGDSSGPWTLKDVQPAEAQVVLEMLATVIIWTKGRVQTLTKSEAEWVVRVTAAAPELDWLGRWRLASLYVARGNRPKVEERSTLDLDQLVAFAPWRSFDHTRRYKQVIQDGWVPRPPDLFVLMTTTTVGDPEGYVIDPWVSDMTAGGKEGNG